jgi:hypothetical protein
MSTSRAFADAVSGEATLFEGLKPNGLGKRVRVRASYADDEDHFVVETDIGDVRIAEIWFKGELFITEPLVPVTILPVALVERLSITQPLQACGKQAATCHSTFLMRSA